MQKLGWLILVVVCFGGKAQAYPEFIGHGYASCLTCHYNGNGGGPLTDYGRALWSAEIASRAFYPKSMSDEQIAAQSGFLGSTQIPWFRPHAKYRGIEVQTNPGSSSASRTNYYQMQTDFGFALQDDNAKYVGVMTFGRMVPATEFGLGKQGFDHIMGREYFIRAEVAKTWWIYAGQMEKVFGLRNIDHTSYQRTYQGFNIQNDTTDGISESQGLIIQKVEKTWEVSANAFFGNSYDSANYRQSGGSMMGEFEIGENKRLGASLFTGQSGVLNKQMAAAHYRQALGKGSATMFEWGLIQNTPSSRSLTVGSYNLLQALVLLTRGYNLKTTIERYNSEFRPTSPDQWKWSVGFLMFPLPRLELRAEVLNMRAFSGQSAADDSWALQGQVHVSL